MYAIEFAICNWPWHVLRTRLDASVFHPFVAQTKGPSVLLQFISDTVQGSYLAAYPDMKVYK